MLKRTSRRSSGLARVSGAKKPRPQPVKKQAAKKLLAASQAVELYRRPKGQKVVGPGGGVRPDGSIDPRRWQVEAYTDTAGERFRIVIAPTGSGKAVLMRMLAARDLKNGLTRIIVAVPQLLIAGAFRPERVHLPDGGLVDWRPDLLLIDTIDASKKLIAFIEDPRAVPLVTVCTHSTLRAALRFLEAKYQRPQLKKMFARVGLLLDESHHSKNGEDPKSEEQEQIQRNRLGRCVELCYLLGIGTITMATATWSRTDQVDILPKRLRPHFFAIIYPIDRYLAEMRYLERITMRFLIGNPDDSIQAVIQEDAKRKTIIYLPPVTSQLTRAAGGKHRLLKRYKRFMGKPLVRQEGAWWEARRHNNVVVRSVDLVTQDDRATRREGLLREIVEPVHDVTWIWALMMGVEGFDFPALSRAIVVGPRQSVLLMEQIFGRILRDYPDKKEVELAVVLPAAEDEPAETLKSYLKVFLATLIYQSFFKKVELAGLNDKDRQRVNQALSERGKMRQVIDGVIEAALGRDSLENDDELIGNAIKGAGFDLPSEAAEEVVHQHIKGLFAGRTAALLRDSKEVPFQVVLKEKVLGCIRMYTAALGYRSFREMRKALGVKRALTLDFVRAKVLEMHEILLAEATTLMGQKDPHSVRATK